MEERRERFRDRTLELFDPRLFPTRESVVEFLRSDHLVALTHAIDRALSPDDYDSSIPDGLEEKARTAASWALDDLTTLVSDAVGSEGLVFHRDKDLRQRPQRDRLENLWSLSAVVLGSEMSFSEEIVELTQQHIDSLQGRKPTKEEAEFRDSASQKPAQTAQVSKDDEEDEEGLEMEDALGLLEEFDNNGELELIVKVIRSVREIREKIRLAEGARA